MVRLGQPVRVITEPGLNVKVPFIDSVIYIDKRILDIESPAQEVIASSQDNSNSGAGQAGERLVVDAFARYRITDPLKFYQTVGPAGASSQLAILLNSALRRVLGGATLADVVRNKREELMAQMRDQLDHDAQPFGIQVIDVRIRRADLPEQNSQAVYQRMQTERQREAAEFRAQGSQKGQEIRAKADRDVTVLLAEANSQAEQVRGQGDGESNRIFADAYSQRPGLLRLLPLHAGLRKEHAARRYALGAAAGFGFLPLFRRSVGQGPAMPATRQAPPSRQPRTINVPPANSVATPTRSGVSRPCPTSSPRSACSSRSRAFSLPRSRLRAKRAMAAALETPDGRLRIAGLVSAVVGVLIVWLVRG